MYLKQFRFHKNTKALYYYAQNRCKILPRNCTCFEHNDDSETIFTIHCQLDANNRQQTNEKRSKRNNWSELNTATTAGGAGDKELTPSPAKREIQTWKIIGWINGMKYSLTTGVRIPNSITFYKMSEDIKYFLCKTA